MSIKCTKQFFKCAYPWLVIALCASFLFYKYVLQVSPSIMTQELMQFFHIDGIGLGNLAASYFYSYLIIQLFAGPLLDRYSPRKLMTTAIFLCATGTLIFSTTHYLLNAFAGRALMGVGAAFATVGYLKIASIYFPPKQFAFVTGFLATAAMIGATLGETPLTLLVNHIGWQQSLFGVAVVGFAVAALFYFVVRDKQNEYHPAKLNQPVRLNWRDFASIFKKKHNWLLAIYGGLAFEPIAVFSGLWGNPFLQETYHLTKTVASEYISLSFIGMAIGSPMIGWFSDRLQNRTSVMIIGAVFSCVSLTLVVYAPMPTWAVGLCLFTLGFSTGAYMLGFSLGRDWNHPALTATVIAFINTGDAILGAITEPLVGRLLDLFGKKKIVHGAHYFSVSDYRTSLSIMVIYTLLSLVFIFWLRREHHRQEIKSAAS